jgi:hypothetical protein
MEKEKSEHSWAAAASEKLFFQKNKSKNRPHSFNTLKNNTISMDKSLINMFEQKKIAVPIVKFQRRCIFVASEKRNSILF